VQAIRVTITRYIDPEPQPGIVEFELVDIHGHIWRFLDKTAIVSWDHIDAGSKYPRAGVVAVVILSRRVDTSGREIVLVDTSRPWGVDTVDDVSHFEVFADQLIDLR
jgi:hypothetical protein